MNNTVEPDTENWVAIAILGRPRGNRGELTAISLSSHPERFAQLARVFLFGSGAEFQVEKVWDHGGVLVFKFAGIDSISDAEPLRGFEVRVPAEERVAPEAGEYFHSDLIGCEVRDRVSGRVIGRVTDFEAFGGPGLLQVDSGRLLIPFVKEICCDIQIDVKLILVDLPEGLEDLSKA